jgi:hypothetical protein
MVVCKNAYDPIKPAPRTPTKARITIAIYIWIIKAGFLLPTCFEPDSYFSLSI